MINERLTVQMVAEASNPATHPVRLGYIWQVICAGGCTTDEYIVGVRELAMNPNVSFELYNELCEVAPGYALLNPLLSWIIMEDSSLYHFSWVALVELYSKAVTLEKETLARAIKRAIFQRLF